MMRWVMVLSALALPVWAAPDVEIVKEALTPGGYIVGKVAPKTVVRLNDQKLVVGPDGYFVAGFDRFAAPQQSLQICEGAGCQTRKLELAPRTYKVQNVKGVPPQTVNPSAAQQKQMKEDNAAIGASRKQLSYDEAFAGNFILPINAETSGVFGSRRTYNGEERSWHKGHDLAAGTGTPVHAPADGIVRLARSTFMSGNLVVVDHGQYLTSLYAHLDSMAVHAGQQVKQGDLLGKVGTTGRSTGPHLHWGMYWKSIAIDPILWVGHTKANQGE